MSQVNQAGQGSIGVNESVNLLLQWFRCSLVKE